MTRHPTTHRLPHTEVVVFLEQIRLVRKAKEIISDPQHPQHGLLLNALITAMALDPPADFTESDPA
ncbi:MAG: hypothetical protein ABI862_18425 [Ilumatobacteraceae bacterium]